MIRAIDRALGLLAAALTAVYRALLSRWLPRVCCFEPTCSRYAALAWTRHGLFAGTPAVRARLRRCTGGPYAGEDWPPGVAPRPVAAHLGPHVVTDLELRQLEVRGQRPRFTQQMTREVHR